MTTAIASEALYRLMAWGSPSYPIGAFSYSHGIEYAVEEGLVHDRASLAKWVTHVIAAGAGWSDAVIFCHAFRATVSGNDTALTEIIELAAALRGSAELALEAAQQGGSFLSVTAEVWQVPALLRLRATIGETPLVLPVVFAVAAGGLQPVPPLEVALAIYLEAFVANLISAAVRIIPLGQTDGQRTIADLLPIVRDSVSRAPQCPLDLLGTSAPMVDWCSMRHETQYTRLFRS